MSTAIVSTKSYNKKVMYNTISCIIGEKKTWNPMTLDMIYILPTTRSPLHHKNANFLEHKPPKTPNFMIFSMQGQANLKLVHVMKSHTGTRFHLVDTCQSKHLHIKRSHFSSPPTAAELDDLTKHEIRDSIRTKP